jgi:uracil-DNA glycosylase family 4
MVLGGSTSYLDDRTGEPFVGPPGELLGDVLAKAGIRCYYKTNVCKCYTGKSGDPPKSAVKACGMYLDEELAKVNPKFILAFGNTAIQRVLGHGKITEIAGKETPSEKYHATIFPALHPAAVLWAQGKRPSWERDIKRLGLMMRGQLLEKPPTKVEIVDSATVFTQVAEEILDTARDGDPVSYDFEWTYGLDWWHKDLEIYTVAFGFSEKRAVCVPLQHPESQFAKHIQWFFKRIRPVLEQHEDFRCPLIVHNSVVDDLAVYRLSGYMPRPNYDTMVIKHLLDENSLKGLKYLGRVELGWPDWGVDTKDLKKMPLTEVGYYNGCDAAATVGVWGKLWPEIVNKPKLQRYYEHLVRPYTHALEDMVARGVYINLDTVAERRAIAVRRAAEAKVHIPVDNPGSTQQIAKWFYGEEEFDANGIPTGRRVGGMGLPILKTTKTGAPSTDEETINALVLRGAEEAKAVVDWRRPTKQTNTYFDPDRERMENSYDGRAHFEYRIGGPETGRLASPFHTHPRDPFVRNVVDAPPGWVLLCADSKQIEARLAAWTAVGRPRSWGNVPPGSMLQAFRDGRDVYKEMAARALNKRVADIDKKERQEMGKVPTLACIYKISPTGLQTYAWTEYELIWSLKEATRLHRIFYELWPELPRWHRAEEAVLKHRGWNESVLGRRRRLPDAMGDGKTAGEAIRSGINMPVQSLASDIVQAAHILLSRKMDPTLWFSFGTVHDSLEFLVREHYAEKLKKAIVWAMNDGAVKYLRPLGLQLPEGLLGCDIEEGPWGGPWEGEAA